VGTVVEIVLLPIELVPTILLLTPLKTMLPPADMLLVEVMVPVLPRIDPLPMARFNPETAPTTEVLPLNVAFLRLTSYKLLPLCSAVFNPAGLILVMVLVPSLKSVVLAKLIAIIALAIYFIYSTRVEYYGW